MIVPRENLAQFAIFHFCDLNFFSMQSVIVTMSEAQIKIEGEASAAPPESPAEDQGAKDPEKDPGIAPASLPDGDKKQEAKQDAEAVISPPGGTSDATCTESDETRSAKPESLEEPKGASKEESKDASKEEPIVKVEPDAKPLTPDAARKEDDVDESLNGRQATEGIRRGL